MQVHTENGNWPNEKYFDKWEIYNANINDGPSSKAILDEIKKTQTFKSDEKYLKGNDENEGIISEETLTRKWDFTHLIARASLKGTDVPKSITDKLFDEDGNLNNGLGSCNTLLVLKFDNIPKNNTKTVSGVELLNFKDHLLVLKKSQSSLGISGYEYLNDPSLKAFIEDIIQQRQDIYKTTYIVGQIYKRSKMDVYGNIKHLELERK